MSRKFITTREAASRLGLSYGSLRVMLSRGGGGLGALHPWRRRDGTLRWSEAQIAALAERRALALLRGVRRGGRRFEHLPSLPGGGFEVG